MEGRPDLVGGAHSKGTQRGTPPGGGGRPGSRPISCSGCSLFLRRNGGLAGPPLRVWFSGAGGDGRLAGCISNQVPADADAGGAASCSYLLRHKCSPRTGLHLARSAPLSALGPWRVPLSNIPPRLCEAGAPSPLPGGVCTLLVSTVSETSDLSGEELAPSPLGGGQGLGRSFDLPLLLEPQCPGQPGTQGVWILVSGPAGQVPSEGSVTGTPMEPESAPFRQSPVSLCHRLLARPGAQLPQWESEDAQIPPEILTSSPVLD